MGQFIFEFHSVNLILYVNMGKCEREKIIIGIKPLSIEQRRKVRMFRLGNHEEDRQRPMERKVNLMYQPANLEDVQRLRCPKLQLLLENADGQNQVMELRVKNMFQLENQEEDLRRMLRKKSGSTKMMNKVRCISIVHL